MLDRFPIIHCSFVLVHYNIQVPCISLQYDSKFFYCHRLLLQDLPTEKQASLHRINGLSNYMFKHEREFNNYFLILLIYTERFTFCILILHLPSGLTLSHTDISSPLVSFYELHRNLFLIYEAETVVNFNFSKKLNNFRHLLYSAAFYATAMNQKGTWAGVVATQLSGRDQMAIPRNDKVPE